MLYLWNSAWSNRPSLDTREKEDQTKTTTDVGSFIVLSQLIDGNHWVSPLLLVHFEFKNEKFLKTKYVKVYPVQLVKFFRESIFYAEELQDDKFCFSNTDIFEVG